MTVSLLEISPEILYLILGQDGREGDLLGPSDYARLCLVNHELRDIVQPLLWKSLNLVRASQVVKIYKAILKNPGRAELVQSFYFEPRNSDTMVWRHLRPVNGTRMDLFHILKSLVPLLHNLRHIHLERGYGTYEERSEVSTQDFIPLKGNTKLETITVFNFRYSPTSVDNMIALPNLKRIELGPGFGRISSGGRMPTARSRATSLTLRQLSSRSDCTFWYPELYRPRTPEDEINYEDVVFDVISSTILCFKHLQTLNVMVLAASFNNGRLHNLLSLVEERSGLICLTLRFSGHPARNARPIDFSTWRNLRELYVDADVFWPSVDSWPSRNDMYTKLPSGLEFLRIHSQFNRDGLFHTYTGREGYEWNSQTEASADRYVWVQNLLITSSDGNRILPNLCHVNLREDVAHTAWSGPVSAAVTGHLPRDIASDFHKAGINVEVKVRKFDTPEGEESEHSEDWLSPPDSPDAEIAR